MSKKIIALSLALVLIIACFTACDKKLETTKINGKDVILVTDEDGNPVINEKNQVIALVTDEAGEVITYENGEDQTRYIYIYDAIEVENVVYGENYKFNLLEGWSVGTGKKITKNQTEGQCYISCSQAYVLEENEKFEDAFIEIDKTNKEIQEVFEDEEKFNEYLKNNPNFEKYKNCKYIIDETTTTFTNKNFPCKVYVHKIVNAKGEIVHYVNNYYFAVNKTIYNLSYVCIDGVGYDPDFDFGAYLKTNFSYVD